MNLNDLWPPRRWPGYPSPPSAQNVAPQPQVWARIGRGAQRRPRHKALVLSGGGAKGAFGAGAIRALHDAGERFDTICGTSIGAFNGAFVAQEKFAELELFWRTISTLDPPPLVYVDEVRDAIDFAGGLQLAGRDVTRLALGNLMSFRRRWSQLGSVHKVFDLRGIYKPDAMLSVLRDYLDFDRLKSTLIVSATNLSHATSDSYYFFSGPDASARRLTFLKNADTSCYPLTEANFVSAVQASASIPGAFDPVEIEVDGVTEEYVDGGFANNAPVSLALAAGAEDIFVIFLSANDRKTTYPTKNLMDIGISSLSVMWNRILELDMRMAASRPGVRVRYVRPQADFPVSIMDFADQNALDRAYDLGVQAVEAGPHTLTRKGI